jgi:hypothetical protein
MRVGGWADVAVNSRFELTCVPDKVYAPSDQEVVPDRLPDESLNVAKNTGESGTNPSINVQLPEMFGIDDGAVGDDLSQATTDTASRIKRNRRMSATIRVM